MGSIMSTAVKIPVPEILIKGEPLILEFTPEEWAKLQAERIAGVKPCYTTVLPSRSALRTHINIYCSHNRLIITRALPHAEEIKVDGHVKQSFYSGASMAVNRALGIGPERFYI